MSPGGSHRTRSVEDVTGPVRSCSRNLANVLGRTNGRSVLTARIRGQRWLTCWRSDGVPSPGVATQGAPVS